MKAYGQKRVTCKGVRTTRKAPGAKIHIGRIVKSRKSGRVWKKDD